MTQEFAAAARRIGVSHQEAVDCEIQKIVKCLFCLKRDPQGWAILSKGHNIKHLCHGQAVYQIVAEFQNWKERVFDREGFDIAFKEKESVVVVEDKAIDMNQMAPEAVEEASHAANGLSVAKSKFLFFLANKIF